jgi:hypothetical protein
MPDTVRWVNYCETRWLNPTGSFKAREFRNHAQAIGQAGSIQLIVDDFIAAMAAIVGNEDVVVFDVIRLLTRGSRPDQEIDGEDAFSFGVDDERVDLELLYAFAGRPDGTRDSANGINQGLDVRGWSSSEPFEERRACQRFQEVVCYGVREWQHLRSDVAVDLGVGTAETQGQEGSERRVLRHSEH